MTCTGVGKKPLQGLLICGQFEIRHSTSISATSSLLVHEAAGSALRVFIEVDLDKRNGQLLESSQQGHGVVRAVYVLLTSAEASVAAVGTDIFEKLAASSKAPATIQAMVKEISTLVPRVVAA